MKYLLIICVIFFCGCETFSRNNEIAWQTMHLIDAAQTVQISKNPHCRKEGNNLTRAFIGENPSESDVYKWWGISAILHYFIFKWTDKNTTKGDFNIAIRSIDTTSKLATIAGNHNNGLRIDGLSDSEQKRCDYERENSIKIPLLRF